MAVFYDEYEKYKLKMGGVVFVFDSDACLYFDVFERADFA